MNYKSGILKSEPLAHEKCDSCIFKHIEWKDHPCFSCKYGKFGGKENNFVNEDES